MAEQEAKLADLAKLLKKIDEQKKTLETVVPLVEDFAGWKPEMAAAVADLQSSLGSLQAQVTTIAVNPVLKILLPRPETEQPLLSYQERSSGTPPHQGATSAADLGPDGHRFDNEFWGPGHGVITTYVPAPGKGTSSQLIHTVPVHGIPKIASSPSPPRYEIPNLSIWVGRFPTVVVSSPDAAHEVLRNADLAGRTVLDAWRAEGHAANSVIFLPPRDKWRALPRFATTELFAKGRLDARQLLRQEKARELVRHVSERAASGEAVDVGHAVFVTAMDLMTCTFFSVDLATRELRHMVKAASLLAAKPTISDIFPAVAAADLQGARRKMGTLVRHGHRIFDQQFMRRRRERDAGEPSKDDMIDVMIDREHEWKQAGSRLNYDAVRGLFQVKEELKTVTGTKTAVEESDISKLPYLQAVVKETLRLHPAVSFSFYRAMATTQVQGYTIPKGSNIMLNIWAIHRKPDIWTDPDEFMPERFIGKDISFWGKDFELIPFGAGRRICLGLPLAHRMVHERICLGLPLAHRMVYHLVVQ
ncbi:hypothetical protein EJB05_49982, partial [Eragrostis curvula]